ncbi:hypothetical protein [Pseudoduganella namucuonensis]|uniref:Uncharacterized protein n=1 Tax=Pseudoduganella namucuonensis TaxID=1035707 RepID=A0A1I7M7I6_9BURK|nr:hypothetical protein [Pseudoduganella namucuonensis]SFV17883.1 hypothetical protein SAMN05216552_10805 [Pseudoduganella namucuonensis]SFV17895.1 hypothetical protein SAMN05216552_108014 [Pseudoduganella namucuonensis]
MDIKKIIPTGPEVLREALIVLGGILIAAWVLSQFPALRKFVTDSSITVKDTNGNSLY